MVSNFEAPRGSTDRLFGSHPWLLSTKLYDDPNMIDSVVLLTKLDMYKRQILGRLYQYYIL